MGFRHLVNRAIQVKARSSTTPPVKQPAIGQVTKMTTFAILAPSQPVMPACGCRSTKRRTNTTDTVSMIGELQQYERAGHVCPGRSVRGSHAGRPGFLLEASAGTGVPHVLSWAVY